MVINSEIAGDFYGIIRFTINGGDLLVLKTIRMAIFGEVPGPERPDLHAMESCG
jgi:hypothetical protein